MKNWEKNEKENVLELLFLIVVRQMGCPVRMALILTKSELHNSNKSCT